MSGIHSSFYAACEHFPNHFAQHRTPMLDIYEAECVVDYVDFYPVGVTDSAMCDDPNKSVEFFFEPAAQFNGGKLRQKISTVEAKPWLIKPTVKFFESGGNHKLRHCKCCHSCVKTFLNVRLA